MTQMFLIIFNSENGKNRLLPVLSSSGAHKRVTTGGNETTGGWGSIFLRLKFFTWG